MNKFDWSRITYDYSHLPWSPTAPGRSSQPANYTTWSKTYYPAPGQSYRRDVIYWPSGVTAAHSKSTKSYAASSCAGDHRQLWNGSSPSFGAVVHDISSKSVSHKRQFPELKSKSELFYGSTHDSKKPTYHRQSSTSSQVQSSGSTSPLHSPTARQQPSFTSSPWTNSNGESSPQPYKRPYRNNSSGVAACLSFPERQHQGKNGKMKSPWSW